MEAIKRLRFIGVSFFSLLPAPKRAQNSGGSVAQRSPQITRRRLPFNLRLTVYHRLRSNASLCRPLRKCRENVTGSSNPAVLGLRRGPEVARHGPPAARRPLPNEISLAGQ